MSIKQILEHMTWQIDVFELRNRAVHENDRTGQVKKNNQLKIKKPLRPLKLSKFWFSIVPFCLEDHTSSSTLNNEYLATGQMCVSYQMMNEKIFIWITYHTKPCWWYTVFGKIRTRNFPPRSPPSIPSFSSVSQSSFLFHVFSADNWWRSRDCLHPPPLSAPGSRNIFFGQKTDINPAFMIVQ